MALNIHAYAPDSEDLQMNNKQDWYKRDRGFGDALMPEIQMIIGQCVGYIDTYKDMKENTDLLTMNSNWALRIRSLETWEVPAYRNDISIRLSRGNGIRTEYDKLIDGYAPYLFYGFMDIHRKEYDDWKAGVSEKAPHLKDWVICDMKVLREYLLNMQPEVRESWLEKRAKKHCPPDNVTYAFIDRREIPGFTLTTASEWKAFEVRTWTKPCGNIFPERDSVIAQTVTGSD